MKNKDYFKGKNILIVGFARSGLSAANLLYDLGARVSVTDNQDNETTRQLDGLYFFVCRAVLFNHAG